MTFSEFKSVYPARDQFCSGGSCNGRAFDTAETKCRRRTYRRTGTYSLSLLKHLAIIYKTKNNNFQTKWN
jgi:hypothetical protein